jgi:hypothetical protein
MTPAAKRKLDLELLRVQVSAEQNLLPLLSPEQQAAGRHHLPALIRLAPGTSGYSVNAANGGI